MAFSLVLALILSLIVIFYRERIDSLIGVIWALGMSIGIIFLNMTPGYNADAMSYLFGNILLVEKSDILMMIGVDIVLLASIVLLYNRFLAMSYDMEFLKLRKINSNLLYTYFLIITALTVVMSVRAIGIILILALFTIPPLIAERFTKKFYQMIIVSGILSAVFIISGILISYFYDLPPTPVIVIIAALGLFVSIAIPKR